MGKRSTHILRPDISLRDNVELNKLLERAAKKRAQQHLTRVGLNTANVFNPDITRSKVPAFQRREDYVTVPDWSTRTVMEQYPSIQRAKDEAESIRKQWLGSKNVARRMFAALPSTIEREKINRKQRIARLDLIQAIERAPEWRRYGKVLRAEWFPGSF